MKFVKKLVLSLGIVVTLAIAFVVGITGKANSSAEPTAPNQAVQDENTKKPVKLNYEPGEVVFQRGGSVINYNYNPSVNSAEEEAVKPVAYEYMFGNTMDVATAVNLKSIDTTGVTVTYAYSYEGKLTDTDAVESVENYTLLPLENKGDTVYIYLIVVPEDAAIPVTFTTSVVWYYGIPQETPIIDNVTGQIIEKQTIVAGQVIDANTLTIPKTTPASEDGYNGEEFPYYFDAWYMDKNFTQVADGNIKAGQQLYARFANLPDTAIASDGTSTTAYANHDGVPYNVVIPTGITNIVDETFVGSHIKSVSIPNTVTTIGGWAFQSCDITSLYIPASVTSLNSRFTGDDGKLLTSITVDANNPVYDSRNDCNAIIETSTNTLITGCATTIIPNDITAIGEYAFYCIGINGAALPSDLVIPSGVTSIGERAFDGAYINIDISQCKQLASIGANAFYHCTLSGILDFSQIPVSQFDLAYAQSNYLDDLARALYGATISKIIFPNGITNDHPLFSTSIACALAGTQVDTIDLSNTALTCIPDACFEGSSIKTLILPNTLTLIEAGAFSGCGKLQVVELPSEVTEIQMGAFAGCSSLHTVYNLSTADLGNAGIDTTKTNVYTEINYATALEVSSEDPDDVSYEHPGVEAKLYLNGELLESKSANYVPGQTEYSRAYFTQHTNPIEVGDIVSYVFELKSDATQDMAVTRYTSIFNLSELYNTSNALLSWYYSTNGKDYKACDTDRWLVHAGQSVYVKLQLQITEVGDHFPVVGQIGFVYVPLSTALETSSLYSIKYETTYSIVDGEAYATHTCPTCGKDMGSEKLDASKYVIATPENAQQVLDSDINGKVVIFDGTFNDALTIRPSYDTARVYHNGTDPLNFESTTPVTKGTYGANNYYRYLRVVENVVFTATDNSVFNNEVNVLIVNNSTTGAMYDPVRKKTGPRFYSYVKLHDITFTNMNFRGANANIAMNFNLAGTEIKGFTIKNCSFITTPGNHGQKEDWDAAVFINSYAGEPFENFVFKNNIIENHITGIIIAGVENVTISNNIIRNIAKGMAFYLQSQTGDYMEGEILIVNNEVTNNLNDRAIRFGQLRNATVTVANNKFDRTIDADNQVLKTNSVTDSTITYVNNTYAGVDMTNYKSVENITSNFIIRID